ncbi:hypothetical protein [Dongia sp.]|uniref:hypothetical protein n=1 Tax=Dongia sp. TaxID=1977262 RepID=UPI0035AFF8E3
MSDNPSRAIRLFGTEEPVTPPRLLRAGPITAEFEAGNLRYIRYDGIEIMRAVSFIVRDKDWGTYNPVIANLAVTEGTDHFRVTYDAVAGDDAQSFDYQAVIEGRADGTLRFAGKGKAATDFLTNRTGFVVLHPIDGVAGAPVSIEHVDGKVVESRFPAIIDPIQPMMNLRALTHEAAPGLKVRCLMEGDTFEMEDQRNWTDASYKTYVRPLALPWPYTLGKGTEIDQAVTLTVTGRMSGEASGGAIKVKLGGKADHLPMLGAGLDPDDIDSVLAKAVDLSKLGLNHVICHFDRRRGHDAVTLQRAAAAAKVVGAKPWLEAVIVSIDAAEAEIAALGEAVAKIGAPFETVLVSPAPDMKCTLPGSVWPPCPPFELVYRAARKAFPKARLGGGMFSYFTELNRKRPPVDLLDAVSFTTSAMVHAGDDRSVTETLQALPAIAQSAAAIAAGKPMLVGPSAIGMRDNPYGEKPKQNPDNIRQAMNWNDPRQRGLLGAAWDLGYVARFAYGGASAVTLGGLAGPFGLLYAHAAYPQPGYDGKGGLFPAFHVLRGLAALQGRELRQLDIARAGEVQGLAVTTPKGTEIWLANLTGDAKTLTLDFEVSSLSRLDADNFPEAAGDPACLDRLHPAPGRDIELSAYAVLRLIVTEK